MKYKKILLVVGVVFLVGCGSAFMIARFDMRRQFLPKEPWQQRITIYMQEKDSAKLWNDAGFAIEFAISRLKGWGVFRAPVDIYIYPNHPSMENGTFQHGKRWMRGFGQYATVSIESPLSWGASYSRERFAQLITHELTHVLMYQTACCRCSWFLCSIPVWFKEGMASYIAGQSWKRGSKNELLDYYLSSRYVGDPLLEAEELKGKRTFEVYEAAHWIFTDLAHLCGKQRISSLLLQMYEQSLPFDAAFKRNIGVSPEEFAIMWREDLLMMQDFVTHYSGRLCPSTPTKTSYVQ